MPVIRIPNYLRPVYGVSPMRLTCSGCEKESNFFLFTKDADYVGPLVLYPLSKILGGTEYLVCSRCFHTIEITPNLQPEIDRLPEVQSETNKYIQTEMFKCMTKLCQCSEKCLRQQLDDINAALTDYANALIKRKNEINKSTTRVCPYCKEEISSAASKCKFCCSQVEPLLDDTEIPQIAKRVLADDEIIYCQNCDEENIVGDKYCRFCGSELFYGDPYDD